MIRSVFLSLFTLISIIAHSQTYTIEKWYRGKECATVMTFDDWSPAHWNIAVPDLIEKGLTGTFFVSINNVWNPTDLNPAKNAGLEIANHTMTHDHLSSIETSDMATEIEDCKDQLDGYFSNQNTLTLAYPFGEFNQNVINQTSKRHIAARTVAYTAIDWGYNFASNEDDYFKIPTVQVGDLGDLDYFIDELDWAREHGGLYTIMYHSIYDYDKKIGDTWFDVIPRTLFRDQLDHLASVKDEVWVTTFLDAICYYKERKTATLKLISENSDEAIYTLSDDLTDNNIYNHPLSIRLSVPDGDTYYSATQNGSKIDVTMDDGQAIFDAVPDGGEIVFQKTVSSIYNTNTIDFNIDLHPMPAESTLTISHNSTSAKITSIQVIDVSGIAVTNTNYLSSSIDVSGLTPGLYTAIISTTEGSTVKKFMKK